MYVKRWEEMGRGRKADVGSQRINSEKVGHSSAPTRSFITRLESSKCWRSLTDISSQSVEPTNLGWLQFQKYCQDSETRARGP